MKAGQGRWLTRRRGAAETGPKAIATKNLPRGREGAWLYRAAGDLRPALEFLCLFVGKDWDEGRREIAFNLLHRRRAEVGPSSDTSWSGVG